MLNLLTGRVKNLESLFIYTINKLVEYSVKHEYRKFPSGAIMLDVWHNGKFYVFQFEPSFIGVSEITDDNVGFDTIPDEKFFYDDDYVNKLRKVLYPFYLE